MGFSLGDLGQAITDVMPTLVFTLFLLVVLYIGAWDSRKWSQQKRLHLRRSQRMGEATERTYHNETEAADFWQGMSITLFGVIVTTVFFSMISLVFQQYQNIQNLKASLIRQMGNPDNGVAYDAVRQLSDLGWLYDGTLAANSFHDAGLVNAELQDAYLTNVNLESANLSGANLTSANLMGSDLTNTLLIEADLSGSQLDGAIFRGADFQGANLSSTVFRDAVLNNVDLSETILRGQPHFDRASMRGVIMSNTTAIGAYFIETRLQTANFQGANMQQVNFYKAELEESLFQNASLRFAYLIGADLRRANLIHADLTRAFFDETTILPDAQYINVREGESSFIEYSSYYKPELGPDQLERFSNPDHVDFWDPCVAYPNLWYCDKGD